MSFKAKSRPDLVITRQLQSLPFSLPIRAIRVILGFLVLSFVRFAVSLDVVPRRCERLGLPLTKRSKVVLNVAKFAWISFAGETAMGRICFIVVIGTVALGPWLAHKAHAFGIEQQGNEPLSEKNYTEWKGLMPLVNDKARVYLSWANGNERLYFKGTTP